MTALRVEPDDPVVRSIFGTTDPDAIWAEVLTMCPEAVDCFAFRASVGALLGLVVRGGDRVALKVHRTATAERLAAWSSKESTRSRVMAALTGCLSSLSRATRRET